MSWFYLTLAAAAEILFVFEMKLSDGFTRIGHSLCSLAVMGLGVFLLSLAVRKIPIATAYAIWTGLGVVGTVAIDFFIFHSPFSLPRLACILFILIGATGLRFL